VVELDDEGDLVGVAAATMIPEHAEVVATALQPPSMASSTMFFGSK
jgi:hypothetical protein